MIIMSVLLIMALLAGCTPGNAITTGKKEPSSTVKNKPTTPSTDSDDPDVGVVLTEELVKELVDHYIEYFLTNPDLPPISMETKLDHITDGRQPVYVKFDPDAYYFVCSYSKKGKYNTEDAANDVWIAFKTASEIPETYRGLVLSFAFQINKAEHAWDITDETRTEVFVEHYDYFSTEFRDGYNIKPARSFDEAFIFSKSDKQYCCVSSVDHTLYDIFCMELDGHGYVLQWLNFVDGQLDQDTLKRQTGKYYGSVLERMRDDYYVNDKKARYAKITLEDIAAILALEIPSEDTAA